LEVDKDILISNVAYLILLAVKELIDKFDIKNEPSINIKIQSMCQIYLKINNLCVHASIFHVSLFLPEYLKRIKF